MAPDPDDTPPDDQAAEEPLAITTVRDGDRAVLVLVGELDPHTAPRLQEALEAAAGEGATEVAIDLGGIRFIDSSGLRVIIQGRQDADRRGHTLVLRRPSPTAHRLLEITGLLDHLEVGD